MKRQMPRQEYRAALEAAGMYVKCAILLFVKFISGKGCFFFVLY
jgi:hypothetical protein